MHNSACLQLHHKHLKHLQSQIQKDNSKLKPISNMMKVAQLLLFLSALLGSVLGVDHGHRLRHRYQLPPASIPACMTQAMLNKYTLSDRERRTLATGYFNGININPRIPSQLCCFMECTPICNKFQETKVNRDLCKNDCFLDAPKTWCRQYHAGQCLARGPETNILKHEMNAVRNI